MFKGKIGIKMKMILSIALSLLVAFSVVGVIILSSSTSALNKITYDQASSEAEPLVARIRVNLDKPISTSNALAECFGDMCSMTGINREELSTLLFSVFNGSADIYKSIFTLWEPDAFDGMDGVYANSERTDSTGRVMYWYYNSGGSAKLKTYGAGTSVSYGSFYDETKKA